MIERYDWAGGSEAMLRFGPETGPIVVLALPLFEEANRTRAFAVTMLRALAEHGVASVLPDFPGQGESLVPLADTAIHDIRDAYCGLRAHIGNRRCYGGSIRSGALLDVPERVESRWHFAPQDGASLLRELTRIKSVEIGRPLDSRWWDREAEHGPIEIAGNQVALDLLIGLKDSDDRPDSPRRVVRLDTDPADADRKVDGTPLWRRSEPGNNPVLAEMLASDIADWIARCDA